MSGSGNIRYVVDSDDNGFMYSVKCICNDDVVAFIRDVSPDKTKADLFCDFLNEKMISPVHLYDVFEEYFYG